MKKQQILKFLKKSIEWIPVIHWLWQLTRHGVL